MKNARAECLQILDEERLNGTPYSERAEMALIRLQLMGLR